MTLRVGLKPPRPPQSIPVMPTPTLEAWLSDLEETAIAGPIPVTLHWLPSREWVFRFEGVDGQAEVAIPWTVPGLHLRVHDARTGAVVHETTSYRHAFAGDVVYLGKWGAAAVSRV